MQLLVQSMVDSARLHFPSNLDIINLNEINKKY